MSTKSARWVRLAAAAFLVLLVSPAPARADAVSMQARRDFPVGSVSINVAIGDFNGDGVADLAVTNYGADTVSVLLGNGDGTFRAAAPVAVDTPTSVAVGDFNGDGKSDLVVTNYGSSTVSVLLGNGDGTF